jgi:hypothetical protein
MAYLQNSLVYDNQPFGIALKNAFCFILGIFVRCLLALNNFLTFRIYFFLMLSL